MAISGAKMIDVLGALEDFVSHKLHLVTECELSPAEKAFALHQLAFTYHSLFDSEVKEFLKDREDK